MSAERPVGRRQRLGVLRGQLRVRPDGFLGRRLHVRRPGDRPGREHGPRLERHVHARHDRPGHHGHRQFVGKLAIDGAIVLGVEIARRIARAIEYTRFPYADKPKDDIDDLNEEEGLLLRAADLIGQLGDPNYMRKSNRLFHEFEETGLNKTLGYATPADIVYKFPQFYWTNVAPQIQLAISYLNVTSSGRQWIANLHSNVFRAEREVNLSGPQR